MTSSDDPTARGGGSDSPGLGTLLLFLLVAALIGGGVFAYQQRAVARQRAVAQMQAMAMRDRLVEEQERSWAAAASAVAARAASTANSGESTGVEDGEDDDADRLDRIREENDRLIEEVASLRRQLAEARGEAVPTGTEPASGDAPP